MGPGAVCITIGGILSLLLAAFHCCFYNLFHWRDELGKLEGRNRKVLLTIHIALILLFVFMGVVSLSDCGELAASRGLALSFNIGYSLFWLWRMVWQLTYLKRPQGNFSPLNVALLCAFGMLCVCYAVPVVAR